MSSNKIGFLSALVLYVSVFAGIYLVDFGAILVGQSGESKAFSIRLENIGDFGAGVAKKDSIKKEVRKNINHFNQSTKAQESKPHESNPKSTADSNTDLRESVAKSTADSHESNAIAQSTLGQNDPYFLAITSIINRFHAREPVRNLTHTFEVGVAFSVNTDGEIDDLRVIKSSGNAKLDNIALRTIRNASRAFPAPKQNYHIKTALVYKR